MSVAQGGGGKSVKEVSNSEGGSNEKKGASNPVCHENKISYGKGSVAVRKRSKVGRSPTVAGYGNRMSDHLIVSGVPGLGVSIPVPNAGNRPSSACACEHSSRTRRKKSRSKSRENIGGEDDPYWEGGVASTGASAPANFDIR